MRSLAALTVTSKSRLAPRALPSTLLNVVLTATVAWWASQSLASATTASTLPQGNGADNPKSTVATLQPPTGWIELKAVAPVQRLWIHQVTSRSVADSSLFAIQAHSARDEKIIKLKRQLELWQSAKTIPDLSPLQVDGTSLEAFELREPAGKNSGPMSSTKDSASTNSATLPCSTCCYTFRASSSAQNRAPTAWRQTWCFTSQNKALVAIERGSDRISVRERLQLLEHEATLQHSSAGSTP